MRTTVLIAVLVAGCVTDLEEPTSTTEQEAGCPPQFCNSNSQIMTRNGIWEANLYGVADVNGVSLKTRPGTKSTWWTPRAQIYSANGTPYDLRVINGRISGVHASGFGTISGSGLVGASFIFQRGSTVLYTVKITRVREIPMPVGGLESLELYKMQWYPLWSSVPTPACESPNDPYGMWTDDTVVFEGDRIDPVRLTISDNAQWNAAWFNLGCAGSVPAKLRVLRQTKGNQASGNWVQRQAALKMLTADYCGNGFSNTRNGTPIAWIDSEGVVPYESMPTYEAINVEARWTERGARCLNTPRLGSGIENYFDGTTCRRPPPCDDYFEPWTKLYDFQGTNIVSALP